MSRRDRENWCQGCKQFWCRYETAVQKLDGPRALRALNAYDRHRDACHRSNNGDA